MDNDGSIPVGLSIERLQALRIGDALAERLRGFGPLGVLSILGILAGNLLVVPMSAILVLLWARRSHTPWREIGFVRPVSWVSDLAVGICFGGALKLLMKAIVMPLLGADPINSAYHHLVGNSAALPGVLYAVVIGAGFGEETVFRGTCSNAWAGSSGAGVPAKMSIVLLTSTLFAVAHYPDQGLAGVQQAAIFGLLVGTIFRSHGPDLEADLCARRVRRGRRGHHLLESRIRRRSLRLQLG